MNLIRGISASAFWYSPIAVYAAEVKPKLAANVSDPVTTSSILQVIIGLVIILAIIAIAAYVLRRFANLPGMNSDILKIVASLSMGPRDRIVLIQAGEQQVLIGVSPGRMQTLCELQTPIDIDASSTNLPGNFQNKFFSILKNQTSRKNQSSLNVETGK